LGVQCVLASLSDAKRLGPVNPSAFDSMPEAVASPESGAGTRTHSKALAKSNNVCVHLVGGA
jgi:hypothetical protein